MCWLKQKNRLQVSTQSLPEQSRLHRHLLVSPLTSVTLTAKIEDKKKAVFAIGFNVDMLVTTTGGFKGCAWRRVRKGTDRFQWVEKNSRFGGLSMVTLI